MRDFLVGVVMLGVVAPIIALVISTVFGTIFYAGCIALVVFTHWFAEVVPYGGDIVIGGLYATAALAALVVFAMPVGK